MSQLPFDTQVLDVFIQNALQEDVRDGDHTSLASIDPAAVSKANLLIKEDGILAGVALAEYIFKHTDPDMSFVAFKKDGDGVRKGEIAFTIEGKIQTILMLERLVLNCMQRMSGIATKTHSMVAKIVDLPTKLIDTRKTTPGFRYFEKWGVRIGGGHNHRFGLFDMILLKDNHVDGAGGIKKAIESTHKYLEAKKLNLQVEIETRNMDEIKQVLATGGVNRILIDNFDIPTLKEAVALIDHKYETEASGGVNEENLRDFAMTGVDYVSSSIMTHSVKSIDLSLKLAK